MITTGPGARSTEDMQRDDAIALAIEALGLEVRYLSFYRCDDCDQDWEEEWSCACDSECPECGRDFSPFDYYQIDQDGNEIKDDDNG